MKKVLVLALLISANFQIFAVKDSDGYELLECKLMPIVRNSQRKDSRRHGSHPHLGIKEITESSTNWSGYVTATNLKNPAKNSVSEIYGTWNVPTLSPTPDHSYCSVWVGIDGFASSSVEQLGTECDWVNGKQVNYAWYEMYPDYSYSITNFPVKAGDSITASVVYKGNNVFVLSIANNTKKVRSVIPTKYTTSTTAQRVCAEWVVEAPYMNSILPLAHFSPITFTKCTAKINGVSNAINKVANTQNTALNMISNTGLKAITSSLLKNGQSFEVTWRGE
ncbi:MAG: G1 family endopeptidase [Candidatus Babeliales bacterium]|nr:G1 family endopeptidase [Candidatus Babeliales bacterium]